MQTPQLVIVAVSGALVGLSCDKGEPAPAAAGSMSTPTASISSSQAPALPSAGRERNPAQPPPGFVKVRVGAVSPALGGNAVLLIDEDQERALVVFVGDTEALSIRLRLEGAQYKRPLTHDLMDNMLGYLGARVHSVRVDRLDNDIFYGVVALDDGQRLKEFDARTSDSVALALGSKAPVFVAREVLDRAGVSLDIDGTPKEPRSPKEPPRPDAIAL